MKDFFNRNSTALVCFICFIIFNSVKVAHYNQLIVATDGAGDSGTPFFPSILVKVVFFTFFFVLLVRCKYRVFFIALYLAQALYISVNLLYYLSFQGYLHVNQYIGLFSEALDLLTHSAMPWDFSSLFVVIDLPFFLGVTFLYPRLYALVKVRLFKPVFYSFFVFFIIYFSTWEIPFQTPLQMMNDRYSSDVSVVKKYGLLTYNLVDLLNYRDARSQAQEFVYGPTFAAIADTGSGDTAATDDSLPAFPDILIIQVESLDAYIVNYRHRKQFVTLYLSELSKKCMFFPYTLSYHAGGSTSDCEFSTLNSVEPLSNFPSIKLRNYNYMNSLLTRLDRHGYSTIAFHGNRGTYFNRNFAFKKMGFQKFYDMFAMRIKEKGWGLPDDSVFAFVGSCLPAQKRPFYYHVITMSSHEPFTLIKPYFQAKRFNDIRDGAKRNYFNSMAYVDRGLQRFVSSVKKTYPKTVIFIYGDHTPTLPKCAYKKAVIRLNDQTLEFVPLFIILPEKRVYYEKRYAASFLDIAPTVLAATGIKDSIRTNGLNLLSTPLRDKEIPFRGHLYSRKFLYKKIAKKR